MTIKLVKVMMLENRRGILEPYPPFCYPKGKNFMMLPSLATKFISQGAAILVTEDEKPIKKKILQKKKLKESV